jgi:hypothetical protein
VILSTITFLGVILFWKFAGSQQAITNYTAICSQMCRADLEKAKATGFWNLPAGTLSGGVGTYVGTTTNSAQIGEWYDGNANFLSYKTSGGLTPATAVYLLTRTTTDSNIAGSGSSYTITPDSVRVVVTTVTRISDGATMYTMGTELVNNGL